MDRLQLFGNVAIDLSTLPSRFPYLLVTPQYEVERVLTGRAHKAGATTNVTGVKQEDHGVDVRVTYADGRDGTIRAGYAAGADGVHNSESPPETLVAGASCDTFAFMAPFGDGSFRIFCWDLRNQQPDNVGRHGRGGPALRVPLPTTDIRLRSSERWRSPGASSKRL